MFHVTSRVKHPPFHAYFWWWHPFKESMFWLDATFLFLPKPCWQHLQSSPCTLAHIGAMTFYFKIIILLEGFVFLNIQCWCKRYCFSVQQTIKTHNPRELSFFRWTWSNMIEFKMIIILYHHFALCIICAWGKKKTHRSSVLCVLIIFWRRHWEKYIALWVSASHPLLHLCKEHSR